MKGRSPPLVIFEQVVKFAGGLEALAAIAERGGSERARTSAIKASHSAPSILLAWAVPQCACLTLASLAKSLDVQKQRETLATTYLEDLKVRQQRRLALRCWPFKIYFPTRSCFVGHSAFGSGCWTGGQSAEFACRAVLVKHRGMLPQLLLKSCQCIFHAASMTYLRNHTAFEACFLSFHTPAAVQPGLVCQRELGRL